MDMSSYDTIAVSISGGKDSQAMLDHVVELATEQGIRDRIVLIHCDLGRVEWEGTLDLVRSWADEYQLPLHVVSRPQGDLLDHVEERGMWPSSAARYCTSDHKRGQVLKVYTRLVKEAGRPLRILECLGLRAQESPARAKKVELTGNKRATNSKRTVDTWLPILDWTEEQVWQRISQSPTDSHPAYQAGMPRLSCVFCVMAPKSALVRAAQLNPELARTYAEVEARIGHSFKRDLSMAEVVEAAEVETVDAIENWAA